MSVDDFARPSTPGVQDFPVSFERASDAELTWDQDDMHMPFALSPLAGDYVAIIADGMNERYVRFGFPQRWRHAVWNGYAYFLSESNVPEAEQEDLERRWTDVCRAQVPLTDAWWHGEAVPELRSIYDGIRAIDVEALPRSAMARAWEDGWEATLRAWKIHFLAILGPYQAMDDLADAYERAVPEAPPGEAVALILGGRHALLDVELATERLVAHAAGHQALADLLRGQPIPARDDLLRLDGGGAFVADLDAFLAEHGHLGQGFDDIALAPWAEDPGLFLIEIAKRLDRQTEPAESRRTRLEADADRLAAKARARFVDDPAGLAAFEEILAHGRAIGILTEIHNYWIDRMAQARIREFAMRVGQRLVREGVIDASTDILFLHRHEVGAALAAPIDLRALVTERRAVHARQRRNRPPRTVGKPREAAAFGDRFDGERYVSTDANVLRGTGASAGVVRGPARVTLSSEDFGRILPGDIIVSPSSNPSWVPVFMIAGGLVTNTGGVLSHAAVVAREFGLPAVVGTGDATDRIADGRTVEIDGTRGTVRLL